VQEQKQQNCPQLQPCLYAKLIAIVPYYNLPNRIQDFLFNFQILLSSMDNLELIISTSNKDTKVVRDALNEIIGSHLVKKIHLVINNVGDFSRGLYINRGAEKARQLYGPEVNLFFTDIDVLSSLPFLNRCQSFSMKNKSVYFPILWNQKKPQNNQTSIYSRGIDFTRDFLFSEHLSTGDWRSSGSGMICINYSDFKKLGKFEEFLAWGMEDSSFLAKSLKSDLTILRGTDTGLFHQWHQKNCTDADVRNSLTWLSWLLGSLSNCEKVSIRYN